jgi:hypothetical protein
MARANRTSTSTSQHQPEHQPEHQHQGPRTGPLGGDCVTIQPPTEPSTEPATDPTTATAPPSLLEILRQLAPPPAKASKASKATKANGGPVGFGVSLTEPQLAALRLQQEHGKRWPGANWRTYSASKADKTHPTDWLSPAFRSTGAPVLSLVSPTDQLHKPEPADPQSARRRVAAIASNLWGISVGALLVRRGRVSVGDALLLASVHGARFQNQPQALTAAQKALPGYGIRWAANGDLELDPAHKLTENPLVSALADRAAADIKLASQAI